MTNVSVLEREMFAEAEAARLLRVPQGTLHYWLEGGTQRGKVHSPILRVEPTNSRSVTWAEFVEAGLLRSYRKHRVPMAELRTSIGLLRTEIGVPYRHLIRPFDLPPTRDPSTEGSAREGSVDCARDPLPPAGHHLSVVSRPPRHGSKRAR